MCKGSEASLGSSCGDNQGKWGGVSDLGLRLELGKTLEIQASLALL